MGPPGGKQEKVDLERKAGGSSMIGRRSGSRRSEVLRPWKGDCEEEDKYGIAVRSLIH